MKNIISELLKYLFPLLSNNWQNPIAIVIVIIVTILVWFSSGISNSLNNLNIYFLVIIILFEYILWYFSTRIKKIQKDNIGIVIAITTENESIQERLKNDFIGNIREVIKSGSYKQFQVIDLSNYHSKKIKENPHKNCIKYHNLTNGNFLVFGHCAKRMHKEKEYYYLKLEASVIHSLIPKPISYAFGGDMSKIFPRESLVSVTDEILGFKIEAQMIGFSTKYILGMASFFSKDFTTAFKLHFSLINELEKNNSKYSDNIILGRIKSSTIDILIIESIILARINYRYKNDIDKMNYFIEIIQKYKPSNYDAHLLKAIYFFLKNRDIEYALNEIDKAKNKKDAAWLYSKAFLLAYHGGNLTQVYHVYQQAFKGSTAPIVPIEVEEFILNVLEDEAKKIQLWYCLGLINYFKKEDYLLAKEYFKKFISLAKEKSVFSDYVIHTRNYLDKIKINLKQNK